MVRFQVLTAASMKMTIFWDIAPCSLVEVTDVSKVLAAIIALMMEKTSTSETSVNFYQSTRRNNPEESHLHTLTFIYLSKVYFVCRVKLCFV
jgi:hypothetical protein